MAGYKSNESDVIWVANQYRSKNNDKSKNNEINHKEVSDIEKELQMFSRFAKENRIDREYEIAVITFYRSQEFALHKMLKDLTNSESESREYKLANMKIVLSTVDGFQGDEADMVLLSFTKSSNYAFYNSPNRLNVALTRARYKLVLFGNKAWFAKNANSRALRSLASDFDERINIR